MQLKYADHVGRFYARHFGFPPMAGRLLGYLTVCMPETQSISALADALMASRSAVTGAIQTLEHHHLVKRARAAGDRSDSISIDPAGLESRGFDATRYQEQAALFRDGLHVLSGEAPDQRTLLLEEASALAEFLAEQMPALQRAWHTRRDALRRARAKGASADLSQKENGRDEDNANEAH
ncbi:MAG TPA: hypothetical protein VF807_07935 [Ktedonobacterales bacterium]